MSKAVDLFGPANRQRCVRLLKLVQPLRPKPKECQDSAVIVPLCYYDDKPSILYTKRSMRLRLHPGEVSFPGGRVDAHETGNFSVAALRELEEEVGIPQSFVDLWSTFCPCPTKSTTSFIHPVVGFCGYYNSKTGTMSAATNLTGIPLSLNNQEVEMVLFRSIDWLSSSLNLSYTAFREPRVIPFTGVSSLQSKRVVKDAPRFRQQLFNYTLPVFGGHPPISDLPCIWGLTGLMTYQFLACLIPGGIQGHPCLPNPFTKHF